MNGEVELLEQFRSEEVERRVMQLSKRVVFFPLIELLL